MSEIYANHKSGFVNFIKLQLIIPSVVQLRVTSNKTILKKFRRIIYRDCNVSLLNIQQSAKNRKNPTAISPITTNRKKLEPITWHSSQSSISFSRPVLSLSFLLTNRSKSKLTLRRNAFWRRIASRRHVPRALVRKEARQRVASRRFASINRERSSILPPFFQVVSYELVPQKSGTRLD